MPNYLANTYVTTENIAIEDFLASLHAFHIREEPKGSRRLVDAHCRYYVKQCNSGKLNFVGDDIDHDYGRLAEALRAAFNSGLALCAVNQHYDSFAASNIELSDFASIEENEPEYYQRWIEYALGAGDCSKMDEYHFIKAKIAKGIIAVDPEMANFERKEELIGQVNEVLNAFLASSLRLETGDLQLARVVNLLLA